MVFNLNFSLFNTNTQHENSHLYQEYPSSIHSCQNKWIIKHTMIGQMWYNKSYIESFELLYTFSKMQLYRSSLCYILIKKLYNFFCFCTIITELFGKVTGAPMADIHLFQGKEIWERNLDRFNLINNSKK